MFRKLFFLLGLLSLFYASPCLAEDEKSLPDLIDLYAKSTRSDKIRIANDFFENRVQDLIDTLYVFDHSSDIRYVDCMMYYWCADLAYEVTFEYEKSIVWCQKAVTLAEQLEHNELLSDNYALLSCTYTRLGDFTEGISYGEQCLELDRLLGDQYRLSSSLSNLAAVCICANQYDIAEKYLLESIKINRSINNPKSLSIRLGLLSEAYIQSGKFEEALAAADEALTLAVSCGDANKVAVRMSQKSQPLICLHRYDEARAILSEAIDSLRSQHNLNSLSISLRQMSSLEMECGNDALAIDYLKQSLEISQQIGNRMHLSKEYRQLADLLKKNDPAQAIFYLEECAKLNDEIFNDKMAQQLQSSNVKFQTAEMQHQLEIQQNTLVWHKYLMIAFIILLLICILVAVLLGRLAKVRGKNNELLRKASSAKDELLRIANLEKLQAESARKQILEVAEHISSLADLSDAELTSREIQIIKLYSQGLVSKEVADQLNISIRTVETHKNHIYRKLGISTTVELLRFAQQKGLV